MEVFLIRHTTPQISKDFIYGRTDVPLAANFNEEKQVVKSTLPENIELVISSPSHRCTSLAEEIAATFVQDARLMELNFGLWEGKTWDNIDRLESEWWMEDYVNRCPPQGETLLEMNDRVMSLWEELKNLNVKSVAIITHAGVIKLILADVDNTPLTSAFDFRIDYGQIIVLNIG